MCVFIFYLCTFLLFCSAYILKFGIGVLERYCVHSCGGVETRGCTSFFHLEEGDKLVEDVCGVSIPVKEYKTIHLTPVL